MGQLLPQYLRQQSLLNTGLSSAAIQVLTGDPAQSSGTSSPTTNPTGTLSTGATPFIRENDVDFSARNLKPAVKANLFFDSIKVNGFSQRASIVNVTSGIALSNVKINGGVFGTTSYAYGEVLGTSRSDTSNLVYLNDNYVSIHLTKVASGDSAFTDTDFYVDDIVYQTADNSTFKYSAPSGYGSTYYGSWTVPNYTFYGKVKKWYRISDTEGVLVVDPLEGRANSYLESTSSHLIFNATRSSVSKNLDYFAANTKFKAGETLVHAANNLTFATVSGSNSYVSLSGVVPTINTTNLTSLVVSSNNYIRDGMSDIVGNNIYIVAGTNQGFFSKVLSVANLKFSGTNYYSELQLQNALPAYCTSNSVYSLGEHIVDDVGSLYGIFHIPSATTIKWPAGQRVFTITDTPTYNDNDYNMRAIATYTASGIVNTTENARNFVLAEQTPNSLQAPAAITQATIVVNDRKYMSQTFFTPKKSNVVNGQVQTSYGTFLSSVDLYFYTKPTTSGELLPFSVAITKVVNGIPTDEVIAERTLDQQSINVSSYYDSTGTLVTGTPSFSNVSTMTKFTFDDPVYLLPETEYAIRLHTESPDYQVWTATVGGTVIDDKGNTRRVSQQPYVGNFFKAQNASNWNPIENQDLMFNINRAVFSSSGSFYMNIDPASLKLNVLADMMKLSMTDQKFTPTTVTYAIKSTLTDGSSVDYITVNNSEIYDFAKDINISSASTKKRRLIRANLGTDVNVKVTLETTDDSVSPIVNKERAGLFTLQSIINNAGIANNLIQVTSKGSGYTGTSADGSTGVLVQISAPDSPIGTQAYANVPASLIGASGEINAVNIINPGSGYFTTPTITISGGGGSGAYAKINGETDNLGGNILAKYQTKIVTLEDGFDSGDLIVRMDAIRPAGTDIQVYFKVLSGQDSDAFIDKKWQRMTKVQDNYSATVKDAINLEYRYNIDTGLIQYVQDNKSYPLGGKFKFFAVKIRLTAEDPSVTPSVDALKVLAVPGG